MTIDVLEFDPIRLIYGLSLGGPASGILFEISVDLLLMTLEKMDGVARRPVRKIDKNCAEIRKVEEVVSGLVDDWSVEFRGTDALQCGMRKLTKFETASGQ